MQRITVKHETPPDKGSDSLIHVCPEAQAEQGDLNEGLQEPLSVRLTATRGSTANSTIKTNTVLCAQQRAAPV